MRSLNTILPAPLYSPVSGKRTTLSWCALARGFGKRLRRWVSSSGATWIRSADKPAISARWRKAALRPSTVRLKVEQHQITEAEWLIVRKGDAGLNGPQTPGQPAGNFFDPDNLVSNPPPERTVVKEARSAREAMIAITNSYFDGITSHDGAIIIAHPGCSRTENGALVTGRVGRGGASPGGPAGGPPAVSDCASNLGNINVQNVAARRYPIVDEESGVVLALAVFLRRPGTATRRNALSEWFVIDSNKIRSIYSAMFYPPPEAPVPNWPPYDGNWPLPPTLAAPAGPPAN